MTRIAVIAVHGVGEHLPGATARLVAQQLQYTDPGRYTAFHETPLSIPVDSAALGLPPQGPQRSRSRGWLAGIFSDIPLIFSSSGSFFKEYHAAMLAAAAGPTAAPDVPLDVAFSRSLVDGGQDYRAVYSTIRLDGVRDAGQANAVQVEVRELFWSDLSHVVGGTFAILEQLFQLLIHMASLGRTGAASVLARQKEAGTKSLGWQAFYVLNTVSYWLLSMPIVTGNLILALLAALLVPAMLPCQWLIPCLAGLAGIMAAGGVTLGWLSKRGREASDRSSTPGIVLIALGCGVAAALAAIGLAYLGQDRSFAESDYSCAPTGGWTGIAYQRLGLAALELPLLYFLCDRLMRRYDVGREGAHALWRTLARLLLLWMAAVAAFVGWHRSVLDDDAARSSATLLLNWLGHTVEAPFTLLVCAWVLLLMSSFASFILGICLNGRGTSAGAAEIGTARLAATLPAPFFLALALSTWAFAFDAFKGLIPGVGFRAWCSFFFRPDSVQAAGFIRDLIDRSATLFMIYTGVMAVAAALFLWAVLPSAWLELSPLDRDDSRETRRATALGDWLDHGFSVARMVPWIAAFGFFVILPLGFLIGFFPRVSWVISLQQALPLLRDSASFAKTMDVVVGGSALTFIAATQLLAKGLSSVAGKLRVPIDVALDVDNWLRERPVDRTVRLKVFARFAGVLAQLPRAHYDTIVIVAHSQGTVVVSEFLRYLCCYGDPHFTASLPPIRLLTMGCPLRQLYAARFRVLYAWAQQPRSAFQRAGALPPPVVEWVNAYGSGDYIGRWLWNDGVTRWQPGAYAPPAGAPPAALPTTDFCDGAAAHTHYLDGDNGTIGACVEALIR